MLFTDEELKSDLSGLTVLEAWVAIQLLDKALKFGVITSQELETVAKFRVGIVNSVEASIGKNIDAELAKLNAPQAAPAATADEQVAA